MADRKNKIRKHFFLIFGEVIVHPPLPEGMTEDSMSDEQKQEFVQTINGVRLNAMVHSSSQMITAHLLGLAQQSLQLQYRHKFNDADSVIVDSPIHNIMHLGFMTDDEFRAPPPGMKLQQMQTEEVRPEMLREQPEASADA